MFLVNVEDNNTEWFFSQDATSNHTYDVVTFLYSLSFVFIIHFILFLFVFVSFIFSFPYLALSTSFIGIIKLMIKKIMCLFIF